MRRILPATPLVLVAVVFTAIGLRFLIDPVAASAARGIVLSSAVAITTARVGFGVFPIGLAAVMLTAAVSPRFRLAGLRFLSALFALALAVRVFSVLADHSSDTHLIVIEAVILLLTLVALIVESRAPRGTPPESLQRTS